MPKASKIEMVKNIPRFLLSFETFVKECLGIRASMGESDGGAANFGFRDLTPTHSDLCTFLQWDASKIKLVLMPRYSFKSTITTVGMILWRLLKNPNERILIYSEI